MDRMKIIIPHEGVNEIPEGFKPLLTDEGKLVSIIPKGMHREDAYWIKTEKIIPVVDWEQRRYELVKAAMQGYCANSLDYVVRTANSESIAQWSVSMADAVIKQLKEGDEWNEFKDWYNGAIYGEHCIFRYEILDNGNVVPDYITAVWNDYTCDYINERLSEYFTDYKITHWKPINKPKGLTK
ncbi:hypothetical protein [Bacteroides thetaiotaomicron]|uniref:DUF551 domain-containing protein n=1 Tax=Bacteroides thetaiotaomicron TaxID=818 RepID=A0A943HP31_BACT4|nr:hypothetical protein [Bacteroides thetaiotaomicron]MBS5410709.1 hypothetical protein [Bacteroides thetaiotaomicron]MDC2233541.1 hypothetical protein [Bacteroides thetaiotaomicron]